MKACVATCKSSARLPTPTNALIHLAVGQRFSAWHGQSLNGDIIPYTLNTPPLYLFLLKGLPGGDSLKWLRTPLPSSAPAPSMYIVPHIATKPSLNHIITAAHCISISYSWTHLYRHCRSLIGDWRLTALTLYTLLSSTFSRKTPQDACRIRYSWSCGSGGCQPQPLPSSTSCLVRHCPKSIAAGWLLLELRRRFRNQSGQC